MNTLTSNFDDCFEYQGKKLELDMSFDNILKVFEMLEDDLFYDGEKLLMFFEMMILNGNPEEYSIEELIGLRDFIYEEFIKGGSESNYAEGQNEKVIMDFKQDAGLIYASFLSCYDMDLYTQHGKLHWQKFRELLSGLDEKTPFMKAVGYRSMDIPTSQDVSKEHKDHIRKMKRHYALKSDKPNDPESYNKSLADTFNSLKAIAKPKTT